MAILTMALALAWAPLGEAQTVVSGSYSRPDATGAYTILLGIEAYMPVVVQSGRAWEQQFVYRLAPNLQIRRVRSFFGVDSGNIFEGHLLVLAEDYYLHTRGPHKEARASYDAWASEPANYRAGPSGANINVFALCQETSQRQPMACHVGLILEVAP